jgi:hypothetical protein
MSIRARFNLRKNRDKVQKIRLKPPVYNEEVRSQSMRSLYSYKRFLIDLIRHYTIKQGVYHPHLPTLIVDFVPIYNWLNPAITSVDSDQKIEDDDDIMQAELSHCDTVVCNSFQKFGAVLGSKLDNRLDHVINVQLVDGVEFGVGICDESQRTKISRRDFMCIEGGYGYYNYKNKSTRMKPKYPPGLYYKIQSCRKVRNEADILRAGDVLTMVVQRENVTTPGGGVNLHSTFGSARDLKFNPMNNLQASSRFTLSFYKNGEDMGFHLRNLEGQFSICLNYYFVESKIRLLSDYNFRKIYRKKKRQLQKQMSQIMNNNRVRSSRSGHRRESAPYGSNETLQTLMTCKI